MEASHPGKNFIHNLFGHFFIQGHHAGRVMGIESMKACIRQLLNIMDFLHSKRDLAMRDIVRISCQMLIELWWVY